MPSPVPATPIILYRKVRYSLSPSQHFSAERVTPKENPMPRNNPLNLEPNVPADTDSDLSFSYSSLLDSSESSDDEYYKRRRRTKKNRINSGVKRVLETLSKIALHLQLSYLQPRKNQRS